MGFPDGVATVDEYGTCLGRYCDPVLAAYRGEEEHFATPMRPSLFRYGDNFEPLHPATNLTRAEYFQIRHFQLLNPCRVLRLGLEHPDWIGLTQHYGGKTRLLDISHNPYVSLFFACRPQTRGPNSERDGFVYVLVKTSFRPMTVRREEAGERDPEQGIAARFQDLFDPSEANVVHERVGHIYAPRLDPDVNRRMAAQQGAYLWWQPPYLCFPGQVLPIRVRGSAKTDILRELAEIGVDYEHLFPD